MPCRNKFARDADGFLHRPAEMIVEPALGQPFHRITVPFQKIERQIHPVFLKIDQDILPEIGELQGRARGIRKFLPRFVIVTAQREHQPPHRIRRTPAVIEQLLEIAVARDGLVLLEGADQIHKRTHRKRMPRERVLESHENRMRSPPRVQRCKLHPPPFEQPQTLSACRRFRLRGRPPSGRRNTRCKNPDADAWAAGS
jgi:hypothetical protein